MLIEMDGVQPPPQGVIEGPRYRGNTEVAEWLSAFHKYFHSLNDRHAINLSIIRTKFQKAVHIRKLMDFSTDFSFVAAVLRKINDSVFQGALN